MKIIQPPSRKLCLNLLIVFVIASHFTLILGQDDGALGATEVSSLAYSPDGTRIAVAVGPYGCLPPETTDTSPFAIHILDALTGQLTRTLDYHLCTVNTVSWSPDGTKLASSSDDGATYIWNVSTGQVIAATQGGTFQVSRVGAMWSPDGLYVADFVPFTPGLSIWDASSGESKAFLNEADDPDAAVDIDWSLDGSRIASVNQGGNIQVWDVSQLANTNIGQLITTIENRAAISIAWSPDGTKLALAGTELVVIDATTGTTIKSFSGHRDTIYFVTWSPAGDRLASAGGLDQTVRIWDFSTGEQLQVITVGTPVYSVIWSPDGSSVAYGDIDGSIHAVREVALKLPMPFENSLAAF